MTSEKSDSMAKSFEVKSDKSNIYLYRNELFGTAVLITVILDDKVVGQTASKTYYFWEVEPGVHEISSVSENESSITLTTEPGKSYFIWQEIKMGMWMARSQLHLVDEETGMKGVRECKRALPKD
jgi:hypothetical protein